METERETDLYLTHRMDCVDPGPSPGPGSPSGPGLCEREEPRPTDSQTHTRVQTHTHTNTHTRDSLDQIRVALLTDESLLPVSPHLSLHHQSLHLFTEAEDQLLESQ